MKLVLILFVLQFGAPNSRADILINLDSPSQTGGPGDNLSFTGTLSNTGAATVFLNNVSLDFPSSGFVPDAFFDFTNNVPISLAPGESTSDIELFQILVKNPFTDLPGFYPGSYLLQGGLDGNAQQPLSSASFSVLEANGVPEPSSLILLTAGLASVTLMRRRMHMRTAGRW